MWHTPVNKGFEMEENSQVANNWNMTSSRYYLEMNKQKCLCGKQNLS